MAKSDQSGFGVNADGLPVQPQPYNEELKIGDKVEFGLYPFDDKRTWKKIGWEILDIKMTRHCYGLISALTHILTITLGRAVIGVVVRFAIG